MFNTVKINIGGKERELIGSFQNIVDIEKDIGESIFALIQPVFKGENAGLTFNQVVSIIYYGLRGIPDNPLERQSIINELIDNGYVVYINDALAFLLACVSGAKKKAEVSGSPM